MIFKNVFCKEILIFIVLKSNFSCKKYFLYLEELILGENGMSEIVFGRKGQIKDVTYKTTIKNVDNNGKSEKAMVIEASKNGKTQTITIFASGGKDKERLDADDKIVISNDSGSPEDYFEMSNGYVTQVLYKSQNKALDDLTENTITNPAGTTEEEGANGSFKLEQKGSMLSSINELWNAATKNIKLNGLKNMFNIPENIPVSIRPGYSQLGGEWRSNDTTVTKTKELSPRGKEYQSKLRALHQKRTQLQTRIQELEALLPQVERSASSQTTPNPCAAMYAEAYTMAGNGTPMQMLAKYQNELSRLYGELEGLKGAEAQLNETYKDVIDEVRTYTETREGKTYQPAGIGTTLEVKDKDKDKTKETDETDETDEADKDITKEEKPKDIDNAKEQTEKIIKAAKDLKDKDIPEDRKGFAQKVLDELDGLKDKLEKGEITLKEAQEKIEKAKKELKKAQEGDGKRQKGGDEPITEDN